MKYLFKKHGGYQQHEQVSERPERHKDAKINWERCVKWKAGIFNRVKEIWSELPEKKSKKMKSDPVSQNNGDSRETVEMEQTDNLQHVKITDNKDEKLSQILVLSSNDISVIYVTASIKMYRLTEVVPTVGRPMP